MKKLPAATDQLLGVVEIDGANQGWLAPVDKRVRNAVPIGDLGGAEAGMLVLAEPAGRGPRAGVKVTELLGDPLAPRAFSLIAIHKHGIPFVFTDEALAEAELAAKLPLNEDRREDLRHLPIVAIDPVDARDHDDAIWAEPDGAGGFRALVAIADVSFYVRPGSEVDREARKRGNSVYFPDRVVPMLPEVLSADVCSLRAGEDRAAMACHLTIDAQGRVTEWRFTRALVRIAEVIAYEDAQARIDAGEAGESLRNLWDCWKALAKAREARNPLALELPERRVVLDKHGKIAEIALRESLDAHHVVEDFMIAANVAAAKALESKVSPVVYRIHEPPSREKLVALKDYLSTFDMNLALGQVITPGLFNRMLKDVADESEKALIMEAVLRSQTQAYYGPRNMGHFGLALGSYAHFTSPIRRYSDLLVHRALVDAFHLEQPAPKAKLPATIRPVGARPRRPRQGQRGDQRRGTPRHGRRARHDRPLRRRLAIGAGGRGVRYPAHRGAEIRPVRHHPGPRRRRSGAGLDPGRGVFHLRRAGTGAGRQGQRHPLCHRRPAAAAAGRGQSADRRAQVRAGGRRRRGNRASGPALAAEGQRQTSRRKARAAREYPAPGAAEVASSASGP